MRERVPFDVKAPARELLLFFRAVFAGVEDDLSRCNQQKERSRIEMPLHRLITE